MSADDVAQVVLEASKAVKEKESVEQGDRLYTLTTGVEVKMHPVNPAIITEVISRIKPPEIPEVWIESKGRTERNPNSPSYLAAVEVWRGERANAMMETFVLNALELVHGLPEDDTWLQKLKMLQRLGRLDLSVYDLEAEFDLTFLYLKNVAMGPSDWGAVFAAFNITPQGVRQAEDNF